jgi:glutathione S-transferase
MPSPDILLVGRRSSQFTRTARIFAVELGVAFRFQPVLDLTKLEPRDYADNPALEVPTLGDEHGPLFGKLKLAIAYVGRPTRRASISRNQQTE